MDKIETEVDGITEYLAAKQDSFDSVMRISRDVIRLSAQVITQIHNGKETIALMEELDSKVAELKRVDSDFKYNSLQAYQEYAEAVILKSIKDGNGIPDHNAVGVMQDAYLMGLMDVVGELKREILESLRSGNVAEAEDFFDNMRIIYDATRGMRFAEAVLQGFRHKQDTARIQVENAGSEILSFKSRAAK